MTAPRFMVAPEVLSGASAILSGPELHHLRVRRLRVGSELVLADGSGQQRRGTVVALDRHRAVIDLGNQLSQQRESPLHLVLAQALLKADKLDLVIEKTTELGVTEVLIFTSDRTIGGASENRRSRWNRIAQSAAKQCQRSAVPGVEGPVPFDAVLDRCAGGLRLLLWEGFSHSGPGIARRQLQDRTAVLAAVGPEGGFSPGEVGRAAAAGFHIVGLAPRILRAETAAIVAVTLCQFFWGDLGWRSADK